MTTHNTPNSCLYRFHKVIAIQVQSDLDLQAQSSSSSQRSMWRCTQFILLCSRSYYMYYASPVTLTFKLNRVHPLAIVNSLSLMKMHTTVQSPSCSQGHYFSLDFYSDLNLRSSNSIGFTLLMVNKSAKIEDAQNGFVHHIQKFICMQVHSDLDLWPLKSIGFILSPW